MAPAGIAGPKQQVELQSAAGSFSGSSPGAKAGKLAPGLDPPRPAEPAFAGYPDG